MKLDKHAPVCPAHPSAITKGKMDSAAHSARNENLQILRFVAAGLVLITHITFYIHERVDSSVDIWHGGEAGVPIFFVISGFVMYLTGEKLPRNSDGAKLFLRRRVARVFPLYWLITTLKLAVAVVAPAAILHNRPDLLHTLGSYILFPMLNEEGRVQPLHGVAWTLLHEMFFYYIFSVCLLLRKSPLVWGSVTIGALWLVGLVVPAESALARVSFSEINLMFVVGMVLAWLHKRTYRLPHAVALLFLFTGIAMLAVPDFTTLRNKLIGGFSIEAVFLVAALLSIKFAALPKSRMLLAKLGDSSYSLYLIHPILAPAVALILFQFYIRSAYLILPMTFVICVGTAHLVYRFVENPLNIKVGRLLDRVFTNRVLPNKPQTINSHDS